MIPINEIFLYNSVSGSCGEENHVNFSKGKEKGKTVFFYVEGKQKSSARGLVCFLQTRMGGG